MKRFTLGVLLALGVSVGVFAQSPRSTFPPISLVVPSAGQSPVSKDQFVVLVIESTYISHEGVAISADGLVEYLNTTMASTQAPYLAIHIREGITYGDFVNAIDALRKTTTKSIAVSMKELPLGREV